MIHVRVGRGLLGRHVGGRAERHAETVSPVAGRGGRRQRLGDPEVGDQRLAAGEHHVVGLDVAVDDAVLVRVGERGDHVPQDADGVLSASSPLRRRRARSDSPSTNGMV